MEKPKHHIFVCGSFRAMGEPQGICHRKDALSLLQYFQNELSDRGLDDVMVSSTGCLKACEKGPIVVVYPEGYWYGGVDEEGAERILDCLEYGHCASEYILS